MKWLSIPDVTQKLARGLRQSLGIETLAQPTGQLLSHVLYISLTLLAFVIPIEHKYDKLFRHYSLTLIPEGLYLPPGFDCKIYFYPSDLSSLLLLCLLLFYVKKQWPTLLLSKGALFLWALLILSYASVVASPLSHYPIAYYHLLSITTPLCLYCVIANGAPKEWAHRLSRSIFVALVAAALLQALLAIAQYFLQRPMGLRLLGETQHATSFFFTPNGHRSSLDWLFGLTHPQITLMRAHGTLPHSNILGGFLALSLLALYPLIQEGRGRRGALWSFLFPLLFLGLALSFSRSALFGWILGTAVWLSLTMRREGTGAVRSVATLALLSLVATGLLLFEQLQERGGIFNYGATAKSSDQLRIEYVETAYGLIRDHPWLGVGFQQYSYRAHPSVFHPAPHNIYLYLAAEVGLPALGLFLLFTMRLIWQGVRAPQNRWTITLIALFIALLFIGLFDFYPLLSQQGRLLLFLCAALLALHTTPPTIPDVTA